MGNHNAAIDAAVGLRLALAAVEGASTNVRINLLGLNDRLIVQQYLD
ncbi:MAG: cyclodeaminase/cyclohydrolase family protein, partial [Anaerolineae bacterium]|nr:cyclodeaminase/cyclohydrolase family protein [Anaerolineae bacterium]